MVLPRLYPIIDPLVLAQRGTTIVDFARALGAAGVVLVQYRDKYGSPQDVLRGAAALRKAFADSIVTVLMNDRADLGVLAGFDGVHVGQKDLSPSDARRVVGARRMVGVSTHNEAQVHLADESEADYVAIGPVFATSTKADAEAVVGLEAVRRARALTRKPLVAIGGITRANAYSAIEAGADAVAVISGLFVPGESVAQVARDFLEILG